MEYKGYTIKTMTHLGGNGYLIDGEYVSKGLLVTDGICNIVPGAGWFANIHQAERWIDERAKDNVINVRIFRLDNNKNFAALKDNTGEILAKGSYEYVMYCMAYIDLENKPVYNIVENVYATIQ